ncbi:hypothetical protein SAMN04487833_1127 [Sarcina sp. DSM 11001]|nr:hypothetical protein SAMN04487833_1127 [Sarcina sp. DSM 11001]
MNSLHPLSRTKKDRDISSLSFYNSLSLVIFRRYSRTGILSPVIFRRYSTAGIIYRLSFSCIFYQYLPAVILKSVEKSADADDMHKVGIGSGDPVMLILRMHDPSISHIKGHMAIVTDNVSRTGICQR